MCLFRKSMMGFLLAAFTVQAYFVLSDRTGRRTPPLGPGAMAGYKLWRQENCQTCHQLYGQGGHLGPDLTNAAAHLSPEALQGILAAGYKQMPPVTLSHDEAKNLFMFLQSFNETGTGQAHAADRGKDIKFRDIPWFDFH